MKKKVLLIVDVQNDFCPGGALPVPNGDEVIEPINEMSRFANKRDGDEWRIFASKDWHPKKTAHFKTWPVHCIKCTFGAELHQNLERLYINFIIFKGTEPDEDGYSPFDGDILTNTYAYQSLDKVLKSYATEEIYICGLATDYCVKAAALDARKRGYKTYLLLDACRAVNLNPGDEEKAIQEMKDAGVIITTTEEVLKENL